MERNPSCIIQRGISIIPKRVSLLVLVPIFLFHCGSGKKEEELPKCGIESCHGLEITCGPRVPEMCDLMYAPGDNCRKYVQCEVVGKECLLKKDERFDLCKACVEECKKNFPDDPERFFQCESKCAQG